ncbi:hypothetical protein Tco_0394332 [Tanacetum coccineum]
MFPTEEELAYHKELLDLGNIIDSSLSEVVLGKPFTQASKLAYDESLGLIRFAHSDDEVVFRMPQRIKELDLVSPLEKDKFEAFFVESLKTSRRAIATKKRRRHGRRDLSGDGVRDLATASRRGRLKEDLESFT